MCNFFSCIVHKDGIVYYNHDSTKQSDNHDRIISNNHLYTQDDTDKWLRVEIKPPLRNFNAQLDEWKYRIDDARYKEDTKDTSELPSWYQRQASWYERLCRKALAKRVAEMKKAKTINIKINTSQWDDAITDTDMWDVWEQIPYNLREDIENDIIERYEQDVGTYDAGRDDGYLDGYSDAKDEIRSVLDNM